MKNCVCLFYREYSRGEIIKKCPTPFQEGKIARQRLLYLRKRPKLSLSGLAFESADGSGGRWDVGVKLSMSTCARGSRFHQRHILRDRRPGTSLWFLPFTVHSKFYNSGPNIYTNHQPLTHWKNKGTIHCKKGCRFSRPQPGCHLPNSPSRAGILKIFPPWDSLVSDIPAGDGQTANFFYSAFIYISNFLCERGAVMQSALAEK
jgi:hypothetical protein